MPERGRVVIAMSGGVDSSLAAALLRDDGYDVVGVTMQIWPSWLGDPAGEGSCCSLSAVEDARRVADRLHIPFYVVNFQDVFQREVIDRFADEYGAGLTPNPCIVCNTVVKYGALLHKAREIGATALATGHYARKGYDSGTGRHLLLRAADTSKDQTYALYGLTQEQLAMALFPLGGLQKAETRRMAAEYGLAVASKPDSQEICFVHGDYRNFLAEYRPSLRKPGDIVDRSGRQLGRHEGLAFYTVGQRKGLGALESRRMYVVELDAATNRVVVGEDRAVFCRGLLAGNMNWIAIADLSGPLRVEAKIRYTVPPAPANIEPESGGQIRVSFEAPQRAVTPGQAVVFYQGDAVVGGGTILKSLFGG